MVQFRLGSASRACGLLCARCVEPALPSSTPSVDNPIIVFLIAAGQVTKMPLAEDKDMIQAISADRTNEPFGRAGRGNDLLDAHHSNTITETVAISRSR